MTNEEAKEVFLNRGFVNGIFDGDKWRQSIVVISKWLEQEPCEDYISRNKVLEGKVIHQSCDGVEIINGYAVPVEYIEQLQGVQPKTGHWIDITNKNGTVIAIRCDYCGNSPKHAIRSDFCSNCGAKMVEPQESEDEE